MFRTGTMASAGNGTDQSAHPKGQFSPRQRLYLTSAVAAAALVANFAVVSLVCNGSLLRIWLKLFRWITTASEQVLPVWVSSPHWPLACCQPPLSSASTMCWRAVCFKVGLHRLKSEFPFSHFQALPFPRIFPSSVPSPPNGLTTSKMGCSCPHWLPMYNSLQRLP